MHFRDLFIPKEAYEKKLVISEKWSSEIWGKEDIVMLRVY